MRTLLALLLPVLLAAAQERPRAPRLPPGVVLHPDLEYAKPDGTPLHLDLYRPEKADGPLPLLLWIHGGGWRAGSKERCPAVFLATRGYAVASLNYRLVPAARFPAQIHDCKAAVRWLRAHAGKFGLDPQRFGAWGSSAGGHLAALLGTSGGVAELEGTGDHLDQSSRVQAVVDFCGPADFVNWARARAAGSPEAGLLGGEGDVKKRVELASPVTHASRGDPPFFIVHGGADRVVPVRQAHLMHAALKRAGVNAYLHVLPDAGHNLHSPVTHELAAVFLDLQLKRGS